MTDIVKETLEDGTEYEFDLDVCNDEAELVLDELLAKEGEVYHYDFIATVFSLFINSIHILQAAGWEPEELIQEIYNHSDVTKQ